MARRLEGKVAIVTGGTGGIGKRTVEVFAQEGASVLMAARREKEGRMLADSLGPEVDFLRTDISSEADIKAMIDYAVERFGRLDCLFNNAGYRGPQGGIETVLWEEYETAMAVMLGGVLFGMKHAAPVMRAQGSGSIINCGSVGGVRGGISGMLYSAAKAAVIHLTRYVALELGESNIRVNCISPGAIATGIFGKYLGLSSVEIEKTEEILKHSMANAQPIPRAGLPDDIAKAAVFLASDESTFVNGHNLVVDGGMIAGTRWSRKVKNENLLRSILGATTES